MKGSIIIGGIVGIALGVIATLLLARGLLAPTPEAQGRLPSAPMPQIEERAPSQGVLPVAPHRPARPGSGPLSSPIQT